jgi:dinuclear metal center YbgI/SA1388 family protein
MSIKSCELIKFLDTILSPSNFIDSSLNGLQVEGKEQIKSVAVAVDAGLAVIADAINKSADILIVHHGIFWGKEERVIGARKKLLSTLLNADLSLYASHLPLDAHVQYGNNFQLAYLLELADIIPAVPYKGSFIGSKGTNKKGLSLEQLSIKLSALKGSISAPLILPFGPTIPEKVCIVSGSAADTLYNYQELDFDTFISGEPKQFAYHFAKENNLNVIFAGHYATETVGVIALGEEIKKRFGVAVQFLDHPTGI